MELRQFIQSFIQRKGGHLLFSFFFSKLSNFLVAVFIIRLLPKSEYGYIAYAATILGFILPFMGAGVHQGFLRYGSLSEGQLRKKALFQFALKKGMLYSSLIAIVLLGLVPFISSNLPGSAFYLGVLSFQLVGLLLLQLVGIYCRLIHLNNLYARIENVSNALLLVSNIAMTYLFQGPGYVVSLALVPFLVGAFYLWKLNLHRGLWSRGAVVASFGDYMRYGLSMAIGSVLAQLLFAVDILLIGNVLKEAELVAQYKAASIIPFSVLFVPVAIIATDFVKLARAAESDKAYLWSYYLNYLKLFVWISMALLAFFYFFGEDLLRLFGNDYKEVPELMVIFAVGIVGGLLFRVPLGNLLSAIGWPHVNAVFSLIVLVLNVVGSYWMLRWYGLVGAAGVTAGLMWLSGLLSLAAFAWFLRAD